MNFIRQFIGKLLLVCILLSPLPVSAAIAPIDDSEAGQRWLDVSYAQISPKQKLDIYLPKEGQGPFPVIVGFHGKNGDKGTMELNGQMKGLARGYAVAAVNYREGNEAKFPTNIMDAKAAVRFIKEHAAEYHLDKSRIIAWGDSMGGRVVSFLGLTSGHPELEDLSLGCAGENSRVNAVVAWFPALDDVRMDADVEALGFKPALPRNAAAYGNEMYGAPVQDIKELVALANPANYVGSGAVPFIIMHGTDDNVCPITQSREFADKLSKAIGKYNVRFVPVKGAGHHVTDMLGDKQIDMVFAFLQNTAKLLRGGTQDAKKNETL